MQFILTIDQNDEHIIIEVPDLSIMSLTDSLEKAVEQIKTTTQHHTGISLEAIEVDLKKNALILHEVNAKLTSFVLRKMRDKKGMTMDQIAQALGYAGGGSIGSYFSPDKPKMPSVSQFTKFTKLLGYHLRPF